MGHYKLLGLPHFEAANIQEVEAAREKTLRLLAEWGDGQSAELAARVKEAAQVLSHPALRQEYDDGLRRQFSQLATPPVLDVGDASEVEEEPLVKEGDE